MEEEKKESPEVQKPEKEKTESEQIDELSKIFLQDLKTNPKYKPFFDQYNNYSVPGFQDFWSSHKARLHIWKDYYIKYAQKYESDHSETAKEKLWEIQQRKLFDFQCKWRANEIKLEGVYTTEDFDYWEKYIQDCPFLTPITQEELDLYIKFVSSSSWEEVFEDADDLSSWQNYNDFKSYYFGDRDVNNTPPPWYEYYESVTGLGSLYQLPDLREEKEEEYRRIAREAEKKDAAPAAPSNYPPLDKRPSISYTEDDVIEKFVLDYEDHNTYFLYKCAEKVDSARVDYDLEQALRVLSLAAEPVYLSSEKEWQQSIIDGANNYIKKKLVDELPNAYKAYLMRIEHHIPFETEHDEHRKWMDQFVINFREQVLKGRELKGEPRNFDF